MGTEAGLFAIRADRDYVLEVTFMGLSPSDFVCCCCCCLPLPVWLAFAAWIILVYVCHDTRVCPFECPPQFQKLRRVYPRSVSAFLAHRAPGCLCMLYRSRQMGEHVAIAHA